MNEDNSNDRGSDDGFMTSRRREFLISGGATAAILGGIGAYTVFRPDDAESGSIKPDPVPETPAGTKTLTQIRDTPWNKKQLTVGREIGETIKARRIYKSGKIESAFQAAVDFWNTYIEENESWDLKLTYTPDAANPDILIKNVLEPTFSEGCDLQYRNLEFVVREIRGWLCVRTLEEHPDETPVSGFQDIAAQGPGMYSWLARHMIGRLIGYDVNTGPVDVMNPRMLGGYDTSVVDEQLGFDVLGRMGRLKMDQREELYGMFNDFLPAFEKAETKEHYEMPPEGTEIHIGHALTMFTDFGEEVLQMWEDALQVYLSWLNDHGGDVYADVTREHILNGREMNMYRETLEMAKQAQETRPAIDSEEFKNLRKRVRLYADEASRDYWHSNFTPDDVIIHRAWADVMWERHMTDSG